LREESFSEEHFVRKKIRDLVLKAQESEMKLSEMMKSISALERRLLAELRKPETKEEIQAKINSLVKQYFSLEKPKFIPGKTKLPLVTPSFAAEEVNEAIDSMLTTYVTMGKKVKMFEEAFSKYIGMRNAILVNSGSSANLLALSALKNPVLQNCLKPGDEIITPATTWATTVYPINDIGAIPVFVDVDLETMNIDVEKIEDAITPKTRAIMPVHLLGNPCDIKEIMEIASSHNLIVIEDTCESYGATVKGKKVGSFGDISTYSFFFAHHITTIEGGMILTNNEDYYEVMKAMRAFGWIRDLKDKIKIAQQYKHIDSRFLFVNTGFNFRPTEIQGAFGIHQMKKLEKFIHIRIDNAKYLQKQLEPYSDYIFMQKEKPGNRHVYFAFGLVTRDTAPFTRDELTKFLEERLIETRPIEIPNIVEQPVINLLNHRVSGNLSNSNYLMKNSFFIGNNQDIGKEEREYIVNTIIEFIEKRV